MKIDLNFSGGFTLNVDESLDDEAVNELIKKIEEEVNAALGKVSYNYNLGFMKIELQAD